MIVVDKTAIGCRVDRWEILSHDDINRDFQFQRNYVRTWASSFDQDMLGRKEEEDEVRQLAEMKVRESGIHRSRKFVVGSENFVQNIATRDNLIPFFDECAPEIEGPWLNQMKRSSYYNLVVEIGHGFIQLSDIMKYRGFLSVAFNYDQFDYTIIGGPHRPGVVRLSSGSANVIVFEQADMVGWRPPT